MLQSNMANARSFDKGLPADFFYKDTIKTKYGSAFNRPMIDVVCLNKKREIMIRDVIMIDEFDEKANDYLKAHMVVIKTSKVEQKSVIHELGKVFRVFNNYAPIVYFEDGHILIFPKLRYQDSYFIKNIIADSCLVCGRFNITYGGKDLAIV